MTEKLKTVLENLMRPWIDAPEAQLNRLLWQKDGVNVPADPSWAAAVKALRQNIPPLGINQGAELSDIYGWHSLRDGMAAVDVLVRLGRVKSAMRLLSQARRPPSPASQPPPSRRPSRSSHCSA